MRTFILNLFPFLLMVLSSCKKNDITVNNDLSIESKSSKSGGGSSVNLSQGLVAYYPFNGSVNDASANRYPSTATDITYTSDRKGRKNEAAYFNGTSSYILTSYYGISGDLSRTVSFWAKTSDNNLTMMDVVAWGQNGNGRTFEIALNAGCNSVSIDLWYGIRSNLYSNSSDNKWHHYCIVYDKNQGTSLYTGFRIYVDGLQLNNDICGANSYPQDQSVNTVTTSPMTIGRFYDIATRYFSGSIDEIRVYDRALNQSEIAFLLVR